MVKLYPRGTVIGIRFVAFLIVSDCSFAMSCSAGEMEIRAEWSAATTERLIKEAGFNINNDFDVM